jgi:hypothetical protein
MSWLQSISGVMGRRKKAGVIESIQQAASALEVLDDNCSALGGEIAAVARKQAASDTLLCEHEWAMTSLREEIAALREALLTRGQTTAWPEARAEAGAARRDGAGSVADAAQADDWRDGLRARQGSQGTHVPRPSHVPPSDLHGFLSALSEPQPDEDQIATAVRTLVAAAWTDLRRDPVTGDRVPWKAPILLLASAPPDRLDAFLDLLVRQNHQPALWLIGRPRDERIAAEKLGVPIHFLEYAAPGPFALAQCSSLLPMLRAIPFGALVFLDTGLWGDRLEHCSELLQAVATEKVYCFGGDDRLYHLRESADRARSLQLTRGLLDWYNTRLVPVGEV